MYHVYEPVVEDHEEVLQGAFPIWDEQAQLEGLEQLPLHEDEAELNVDGDGGEDGERVAVEAAAEQEVGLAQEVDQAQQQQEEKRDEERKQAEVKRQQALHVQSEAENPAKRKRLDQSKGGA